MPAASPGPDAAARPVGVALGTPYLPELEGLRGVAMLLVLAFHSDGLLHFTGRPSEGEVVSPLYALIRGGGDLGVDLFFVLSSFLLTLPFLRGAAAGRPPSLRRYAQRRALRILPLYYFAVLVGVLANTRQAADLLRGVPYLFFLNSFPGLTEPLLPFSGVWWSLATEWQFYVVLALTAWLCRTPTGRRAALGGLALWGVAYAAWLAGAFAVDTTLGRWTLAFSLFGRAPSFLFGAMTAWLYVRHGEALRARLRGRLGSTAADVAFVGAVAAIAYLMRWVTWFGAVRNQAPPWHGYHLLQALLCAALLAVVVLAPTRARALLCRPILLRLGVLSYSMYVWHVPVLLAGLLLARGAGLIGLAGWTWRSAAVVAALWLVSVAISEVTFRCVERPFLVRKQRVAAT